MEVWEGNLILSNGHVISDIHLSADAAKPGLLPSNTRLRFLAFVDPSRIPLHYFHGPRLDVWTSTEETQGWFGDVLIRDDADAWWHDARPESPIAVLAAVDYLSSENTPKAPGITELLFTASRSDQSTLCPPTPPQSSQGIAESAPEASISLQAYLINSNTAVNEFLVPLSPSSTDAGIVCGTFLPESPTPPTESSKPSAKPPTTLKRKSLADTFDEADVLRKRVRSKPGESVQAASATGPSMPTLKELKSNALENRASSSRPGSAAGASHVPMQTRPLSRSPSLSSLGGVAPRSASANRGAGGAITEMKKSGLGRVQSISSEMATTAADPEIETKNKDVISRLVMAGMRLYGLSQSKVKKSERHQRRSSVAPAVALARSGSQSRHSSPAPAVDTQPDDEEAARKDEEWKLVYHSTYRGATFAFRAHMSSDLLQPHTEILRQVVDKLLALYCCDPLAAGLPGLLGKEKVTPGGRKAFATPRDEEGESPFAAAGAGSRKVGEGGDAITPSLRKKGVIKRMDERDV